VRDFRAELRDEPCWDLGTEAIFAARGEALDDRVLQNREELIGLCELIEREGVRSYLEIGVWTGRLVSALHRVFRFDLVAACDHGWAEQLGFEIRVPLETRFFRGDSGSAEFRRWRAELGHIDLVLIDADHRYHAVRRDFAVNRGFPHRFLAFHDIRGARPQTAGVRRFWDELDEGFKLEIVRPHRELGIDRSLMGIGVWSRIPLVNGHAPASISS
jgi:hypothetical protein